MPPTAPATDPRPGGTHGPDPRCIIHGALQPAYINAVSPTVPTDHGGPGGTTPVRTFGTSLHPWTMGPRCITHGPWVHGASPPDHGPTVHHITPGPWVLGASPSDRGPTVLLPRTEGPRCASASLHRHGPTDGPTDHGGPDGTTYGPDPRCIIHGPWVLGASPTDRGSTVLFCLHAPMRSPRWCLRTLTPEAPPMIRTQGAPRTVVLFFGFTAVPWSNGTSGNMGPCAAIYGPRFHGFLQPLAPAGSSGKSYGPRCPWRHHPWSETTVHHGRWHLLGSFAVPWILGI